MDQERREASQIGDAGVIDRAKDAMDSAKDAMSSLRPADNPMLMLLGGLAVGFIIGMLVPISRFENEQVGPVADDLKDRVREAGAQAARRGGEVIKDSIDAAAESVGTTRQGSSEY